MPKSDCCFLQSRHKYHKRLRNDQFDDELNNLFNKKFQFRFDPEWKLPCADSWFAAPAWTVTELESLKSRLNFHKSQLNDFDIEEWSAHTRRRNPAGEVCWKIRCLVNPEFLTQAWTKFYECAYSYKIIPDEAVAEGRMVSLHLCEAPGAFITSLNHYLKLHYEHIEWQWLANTLNPYHEGNSPSNMISDDRFMFHTLGNWDFGVDNTGNLMNWDNSQAIVSNATALGKVMLVTGDGSIDCVERPDTQEEITSPLHYCEIVTALQALSPGGTLIFKLFTVFEHASVNLLYLINHMFTEVNIYKPVTSRQGNSEVYAVCLQYKGVEALKPFLPKLKLAYGTSLYENASLFAEEDIPESFLKQVEECAFYFSSIQCQVINNNLQAYLMKNNVAFNGDVKKIRSVVAAEYIRQYDLRPLEYEQEVLKGVLHEDNKVNTNPRYHRGSFTERQLYSNMTLKGKCKSLITFLRGDIMMLQIFIREAVEWKTYYDAEAEIDISFTYGAPLATVNSTKFMFVPIFRLYNQILAEDDFMEIVRRNPKDNVSAEIDDARKLKLPDLQAKEKYDDHEKKCLGLILDALKDMAVGQSLQLDNCSLVTHFNVSILYMLCKKCFEKIGFTSTNSVVLSNLVDVKGIECVEEVQTECKSRGGFSVVLNSLPVNVTNVGDFYSSVVQYNNTFCRNRCSNYLSAIEEALTNE